VPEVSTRLHVADGQYWIWDPAADLALPEAYDGLIAATARLAVVRTGTHTGWVAVRVAVAGAAPGLDADGWDEVAEVSLSAAPDSPGLSVISDGSGPDELAALTPAGAGSYRVRVHARGQDDGAAADVVSGVPVEEHLIQVWPAPPAPEAVHKTVGDEGEPEVPAGPWDGPTDSDPAHVALGIPVAGAGRAEAVLAGAWVYPDGILFEVRASADVEGLRPREAQRARKAVDGYEGAQLPGTASAGGLRVRVDLPDGRSADSAADWRGAVAWGAPPALVLADWATTRYPDGSRQVAERQFWCWPRPPAAPFTLTLEWPALGLLPAAVTVDGAAWPPPAPPEQPLLALFRRHPRCS
jgi:hypothetical protein